MNFQELNFQKYINKIKKRLIDYINYHFETIDKKLHKSTSQHLTFNESLLEQWQNMLHEMIVLKQQKEIKARPIRMATESKLSIPLITSLNISKNLNLSYVNSKFIINIQKDELKLYQFLPKSKQKSSQQFQSNTLAFGKGLLKKYSSYNFIDQNNAVIIGGSLEDNPNLKSNDILNFNIPNQQIIKISSLSYGVSSHASCRINNFIYIIGGNKDFNTVTKSCLKYDIMTKEVSSIHALNYPSASHTAISWRNEYIYKIGGIGSCFGSWDLSPYIQRYDIDQDEWQVINPLIKVNEGLLDSYSLLVNSLAFFNSESSIVILGGFDIDFKGSSKILEMKIQQKQIDNDQMQHLHEISVVGHMDKLQNGGFFPQQPIHNRQNQLIALQTIYKQKYMIKKVVKISYSITYL